jgi:EpsI family protein
MNSIRRNILLMLFMVTAFGMAIALHPNQRIADQRSRIDLESMIPKQFGDWKIDEKAVTLQIDPQRQAVLNHIYNQTLSRTYVNQKGESIMLSIAYGGDQSNSMQVHKPEVCYPAQGFNILKNTTGSLVSGFGGIPVRRLVAQRGLRIEPITYWIRIGDVAEINSVRLKLERLRYRLTGYVPDGLIFRVSNISPDDTIAFQLQEEFIRSLLSNLDKNARISLIGGT